ncbi:MAG: hypothetical protein KGI32_04765, partial [Gammaproteobacteria bacterium]|nr:hypothetical protein [Gammaproteobacteria bacterium]
MLLEQALIEASDSPANNDNSTTFNAFNMVDPRLGTLARAAIQCPRFFAANSQFTSFHQASMYFG